MALVQLHSMVRYHKVPCRTPDQVLVLVVPANWVTLLMASKLLVLEWPANSRLIPCIVASLM